MNKHKVPQILEFAALSRMICKMENEYLFTFMLTVFTLCCQVHQPFMKDDESTEISRRFVICTSEN